MQVEVLEERQLLSTITVNTTADDTTADTTLSLREAIEVSNGTLAVSSLSPQEQAQVSGVVGPTNTIDFNIPTSDPGYNATTGTWTIALQPSQSALPAISTNAAIINGYSQPGASKNTLAQGDNAKVAIAIDVSKVGGYGLTLAQQGSQLLGLDIENCSKGGVLITGTGIQVAGCFIGTDPTGETAAPDAVGVVLENSLNTIGGPNVGDRNVISGASGLSVNAGVYVPDQATNPLNILATGNVIENNYIGTDATGTKAIKNEIAGVEDFSSGNTYGGTTAGLGNLISGNGEVGIWATGGITIENNSIGTDVTGKTAIIGNSSDATGIEDFESASGTSISTTISNNLISGNYTGISLNQTVGSSSSFTIASNLIGTDVTGTTAIGGLGFGLDCNSIENATVTNNVISAFNVGVEMQSSTPSTEVQHDVFQGNLIGTDKTGQVALGNTLYGIEIQHGTGITIGGTAPGQGNVIANSSYYGIFLQAGQQVQFTRNSIFGNAKGGIDVGYLQNGLVGPPNLTFAPGTGSTGTLSGTLTEAKNSSYVVEIFSNSSSVGGQGQTFVQDVPVTTDGSGQGTFSLPEPTGFYTATTTDALGDTSAFSGVAGTPASAAASVTLVSSSANPSQQGQQVTFTAIVSAPGFQGTPTGTVTFTIDGQAQTPISLTVVGGMDEAQYVTSTLTAGQHSVTAAYSGDANVSPSNGSLPTQTVSAGNLKATTTTLTSSLDPSTVGQELTFTAVVSPGATAGTPTGSVTFTVDGTPETPVPLQVVKGSDQAAFTIATLTAGKHSISATFNGDTTFAASTAQGPFIQTVAPVAQGNGAPPLDGPTVEFLRRYGIHMQPTVLVLTFNDGLDPASAQDLSNYKLVGPAGRSIAITSAVYDPTSNTVTLSPRTRVDLHDTYQLTVIGTGAGGVTDTRGALLDGADTGQPGSNYTAPLTWRNVVLTPAEARKYGRPKASKPAGALSHKFLSQTR